MLIYSLFKIFLFSFTGTSAPSGVATQPYWLILFTSDLSHGYCSRQIQHHYCQNLTVSELQWRPADLALLCQFSQAAHGGKQQLTQMPPSFRAAHRQVWSHTRCITPGASVRPPRCDAALTVWGQAATVPGAASQPAPALT